MDAFSNHPIALVLVLAFAVLAATVDLNVSPDAATASHEAGQVTDVGER